MPPSLPSFKERPVINSNYISSGNTPQLRSFDLNALMYWIKRTPECIGILKRITDDIVTDIYFTPVDSNKPGPGRPSKNLSQANEDKANTFSSGQGFKQKCKAAIFDWAATGDFYLWKGKITDSEYQDIVSKYYKEYGIDYETKSFIDEDYSGVSSLEVVPSTMTKIRHNNFKITAFEQEDRQRPGTSRIFNPDEIIHGKFIEIDGSVYGFSPMEASYTAIRTVNAIQNYGWYYFENGAKIDRVWKYMGNPNPEYWEKFKEDVRQYISVRKAHGHLFIAGAEKIESEVLNDVSEEMEYRNLAIHSIGRIAFAFNMPADILSSILGKDIKGSAGSSDVEDAGYNRNIERAQSYFEELMNSQLWIPYFKVEMHFVRTFRQDQIRQVQYLGQAIPVCEFMFKHDYPVSDDFFHNFLQIPRQYLTEAKIKREVEELGKPFQMLPNNKVMKGEASQAYQESKKKQQKPQETNSTPTGS